MSLVDANRIGSPTVKMAVRNINFSGTVVCILLYRQLREMLRYKAKDFNVHSCRRCLETSTDFTECVENIQGILVWVWLWGIIFLASFKV